MQKGTKAELQMLRELAWAVLPRMFCHFCHQPIHSLPNAAMTFGHRRHPTISCTLFTMHHENRDREDNRIFAIVNGQFTGNIRIAHKGCHIRYHSEERKTQRDTDVSSGIESI